MRSVAIAGACACLALLAAFPVWARGDPIAVGNDPAMMNPDYRGYIRFDSKMTRILMKIRRGGTRVVFQARGVTFACDDGDVLRLRLTRHHARMRGNGTFDIDRFDVGGGSSDPNQAYYRVHGRFARGGNAHGFLAAGFDPWDPPGGDNAAECTTFGKVRWKATPLRGAARR